MPGPHEPRMTPMTRKSPKPTLPSRPSAVPSDRLTPLSRRELLRRSGLGLGSLALGGLLADAGLMAPAARGDALSDAAALNPLAVRQPHFAARAKRVIHIFANGGPSHVDTFDPKLSWPAGPARCSPASFWPSRGC
jgi:hypothetical protein